MINKPLGQNLVLLLQELESKSFERVPSDVAVHQPSSGIVGVESDDEVACGREESDIAAGWVVKV
jgi:hypothetical protein